MVLPVTQPKFIENLGDIGLNAVVTQVKELLKVESQSQRKIGELLAYAIDRRLPQKNGYDNARQMFEVEFKDTKKSTLNLYIAVARNFSEAIAQLYGVTKLGRFLALMKETKEKIPADPGPYVIKVPQRNAPDLEKTFAECTRDELNLAITKLKKPKLKLPVEHADVVDRVHDTVIETLGPDTEASVKAVSKDGRTLVSIEHVDVEALDTLLAALVAAKAPRSDTSENAPPTALPLAPISPVGGMPPEWDTTPAAPPVKESVNG